MHWLYQSLPLYFFYTALVHTFSLSLLIGKTEIVDAKPIESDNKTID